MALLNEYHRKYNERVLALMKAQQKQPVSLEEAMAQYDRLERESSRRQKPPESERKAE